MQNVNLLAKNQSEGFVFYKATNQTYQRTTSPIVAFKLGEKGYWPIDSLATPCELNHPQVNNEILESAEMGSMFGWHTPGAKLAIDFVDSLIRDEESVSS